MHVCIGGLVGMAVDGRGVWKLGERREAGAVVGLGMAQAVGAVRDGVVGIEWGTQRRGHRGNDVDSDKSSRADFEKINLSYIKQRRERRFFSWRWTPTTTSLRLPTAVCQESRGNSERRPPCTGHRPHCVELMSDQTPQSLTVLRRTQDSMACTDRENQE